MSATLLPNGSQVFLDLNGDPLSAGAVWFYTPGTTTLKDTWQDAGQTILNSNPVLLDAAGRAVIYGSGAYRQVVFDASGNQVWDQVTADTAYFPNGVFVLPDPFGLFVSSTNRVLQWAGDGWADYWSLTSGLRIWAGSGSTDLMTLDASGNLTIRGTLAQNVPLPLTAAQETKDAPDRIAELEERIATLEAWVDYWRQQAR